MCLRYHGILVKYFKKIRIKLKQRGRYRKIFLTRHYFLSKGSHCRKFLTISIIICQPFVFCRRLGLVNIHQAGLSNTYQPLFWIWICQKTKMTFTTWRLWKSLNTMLTYHRTPDFIHVCIHSWRESSIILGCQVFRTLALCGPVLPLLTRSSESPSLVSCPRCSWGGHPIPEASVRPVRILPAAQQATLKGPEPARALLLPTTRHLLPPTRQQWSAGHHPEYYLNIWRYLRVIPIYWRHCHIW